MSIISKGLRWSVVGLCLWLGVFFLVPDARPLLDEEDNFAENATVLLLCCSFFLGLILFFRCSVKAERRLALGVGLAAGIGAADELSLSIRLLNGSDPMIGEKRIDGIHDFVQVIWDQKLVVVILAGAALWLGLRFRRRIVATLRNAAGAPCLAGLILAGFFIGLALFFDLHIIDFAARHAVEEYFELMAASLVLFNLVALARYGLRRPDLTGQKRPGGAPVSEA